MYLKSLELIGFKSFADKIKLDFEPGMTAIVGPNGCGKSNVSDGIRWVIGETSPKALRGTKMEDVIFNGTDDRKPLGMAEVSLTLGDCEGVLETEFNEVTVSRRVFRSGEGQYFINRTPCRLKDIQRLFMDTGIGTSSYSMMEQGRIDQILSSRPEDRREIFEEASGITKFKSDKAEAMRKLDHTEANLVRLADVIREVKRQIGSLQRQAGKARRYKEIRDELHKLDVFATRERVVAMERDIHSSETELSSLSEAALQGNRDVAEKDVQTATQRDTLVQMERDISTVLEAGVHAQGKLEHTRELIQVNRQRIEEYRAISARDSREIGEITRQISDNEVALKERTEKANLLTVERAAAEKDLTGCLQNLREHQENIDGARNRLQALREESVELESQGSKLRNQLVDLESRERSSVFQRERLTAEKMQLGRTVEAYEKRHAEMAAVLEDLRQDANAKELAFRQLEMDRTSSLAQSRKLQQEISELQSRNAAKNAQLEILSEKDAVRELFPPGARLLMDSANPLGVASDKIVGDLVSTLEIEEDYRLAVQSVLRAWLDAVVVRDRATAMEIVKALESGQQGSVRLLSLDVDAPVLPPLPEGAVRLIDHVTCPEHLWPVCQRLIGSTILVSSASSIPEPVPPDAVYVTRQGALVRGNGSFEVWVSDAQMADPLSRKHVLAGLQGDVSDLQAQLHDRQTSAGHLNETLRSLDDSIVQGRLALDESKLALAQKEGEAQIVSDETSEAKERLETVMWELQNIESQGRSGTDEKDNITKRSAEVSDQRDRITGQIAAQSRDLQNLENRYSQLHGEATDRRLRFAEISHKLENIESQQENTRARVAELKASINAKSEGINSYESNIEDLTHAIELAEKQLIVLEKEVVETNRRADELRAERQKHAAAMKEMEAELAMHRARLEEVRSRKQDLEIRLAENRLRRQNQIERIVSEYGVSIEQVMAAGEPEWQGDRPSMESVETAIAELRTKLDAMGPVNLVAIEELQELEERHAFLCKQEEDLVNAKQQLMEMIRKINRTTSEMFKRTFDQVNINFQNMYRRLFDGGSAKLVLVNEEDVLDCGIEIIARPPGKKLQNISLLSGGERTLTAVALLFGIYMCKPSPFCLLDELDAALDESNIGRFVRILQDFLKSSQFVVITHNRQTIAAADTLYGVTMPEKGISNIMSVKFKDVESNPDKMGVSGP